MTQNPQQRPSPETKRLKAINIRRHVSDGVLEPSQDVVHGFVVSRVDLQTAADDIKARFSALRFVKDGEPDWLTIAMFLNMAIRETGLVTEFRVPVTSDGKSFTYRHLVTELYNTQRALASANTSLWETRKRLESLTIHKLWRVYSPEGAPLFVVDNMDEANQYEASGLVVRQMCSVDQASESDIVEPDSSMVRAAQEVAHLTPELARSVWVAMEKARLGIEEDAE